MCRSIAVFLVFVFLSVWVGCSRAVISPRVRSVLPKNPTSRFVRTDEHQHVLKDVLRHSEELRQRTTQLTSPGGYTLDPCEHHEDCLYPRACALPNLSGPCLGSVGCVCIAKFTQLCTDCKECENYPNETCVRRKNRKEDALCASSYYIFIDMLEEVGCDDPRPSEEPDVSPDVSDDDNETDVPRNRTTTPPPSVASSFPSPSRFPTESGGNCIDAEMLAHLPQSEKVFSIDRTASVLCDPAGSCATPGHMVVFKGAAMTMNAYCEYASNCEKRELKVNSPRYRRRLRIASKSESLEFTALAARFETRLESAFLSWAIHNGA